ncbi:hypothetical protein BDV10DRAFT_168823 [Aspergillus recurvatus]
MRWMPGRPPWFYSDSMIRSTLTPSTVFSLLTPVIFHRPTGGTTTATAKDVGAIPKSYAQLYGLSAEEIAKRLDALEKTTKLQIVATADAMRGWNSCPRISRGCRKEPVQ